MMTTPIRKALNCAWHDREIRLTLYAYVAIFCVILLTVIGDFIWHPFK